MSRFSLLISGFVLTLSLILSQPATSSDACVEITGLVLNKVFVAKESLYDTKIAASGIVKLEWDKEAIPKGASFRVLDVECKNKKIELTLRQEADIKLSKVEIYFLMTKPERFVSGAFEKFQDMMKFVMEPPPEDSK